MKHLYTRFYWIAYDFTHTQYSMYIMYISFTTKLLAHTKHKFNVTHLHSASQRNNSFYPWLAGFVDGDGCFSFGINKKPKCIQYPGAVPRWNATFSIGCSKYNLRLMHVIKKQLTLGSINHKAGKDSVAYRIRDMPSLRRIQSIFVEHKLYTTKQYYFLRWCKALDIIQDNTLSAQHKHEQLSALRDQKAPGEYKSQHWECSQPCTDWVSGFVEAEGSFFITKKNAAKTHQEKPRFVHAFGITQKLDPHVMEYIRRELRVKAKLIQTKTLVSRLESHAHHTMEWIATYFQSKLRGMKNLEYVIWCRTLKYRGNAERLSVIQARLRDLRKKREPVLEIPCKGKTL